MERGKWQIASCLGPHNLAKCLEAWDEDGIEVKFVTYSGQHQVRQGGLISAGEVSSVPTFTVIGVYRGKARGN